MKHGQEVITTVYWIKKEVLTGDMDGAYNHQYQTTTTVFLSEKYCNKKPAGNVG